MTRHRTIASTIALIGLSFGVICATANAGTPLLSGYGSPGAGEQAILGSQLLNGSTNGKDSGRSLSAATPTRVAEGRIGQVEQQSRSSASRIAPNEGAVSTSAVGGKGSPETSARSPERNTPRHASIEGPDQSSTPKSVTFSQVSYSSRLGLSGGGTLIAVLVAFGLLALALLTRRLSKLQR
jgi:hypothetical protein